MRGIVVKGSEQQYHGETRDAYQEIVRGTSANSSNTVNTGVVSMGSMAKAGTHWADIEAMWGDALEATPATSKVRGIIII